MEDFLPMGYVFSAWRRRAGAALEPFGITFHQYVLVRLLRRKGAMSPSEAASELGADRPTLTLLARKCVHRGWIARSDSVQDGRASRLALTGRGEELLDRIEAVRPFSPEAMGDPLDVLGSEERTELRRMLDKASRRARDLYRR